MSNQGVNLRSDQGDVDAALSTLMQNFETDTKLLQAIGHLIQWVADHILNQIANFRKCRLDLGEISTSRQLLLIIRLWSVLHSACTPQFTVKDGKTDIIVEAFKLLTEIWVRMGKKEEVPSDAIERCERLRGKAYVENPYIEPSLRYEK